MSTPSQSVAQAMALWRRRPAVFAVVGLLMGLSGPLWDWAIPADLESLLAMRLDVSTVVHRLPWAMVATALWQWPTWVAAATATRWARGGTADLSVLFVQTRAALLPAGAALMATLAVLFGGFVALLSPMALAAGVMVVLGTSTSDLLEFDRHLLFWCMVLFDVMLAVTSLLIGATMVMAVCPAAQDEPHDWRAVFNRAWAVSREHLWRLGTALFLCQLLGMCGDGVAMAVEALFGAAAGNLATWAVNAWLLPLPAMCGALVYLEARHEPANDRGAGAINGKVFIQP